MMLKVNKIRTRWIVKDGRAIGICFGGANIKDLVSLCVVGKDEEDSNADKSDHLP
jgi:hypothetical protein